MKKLRDKTIGQIVAILDKSVFTIHAFEANFNTAENDTVRIVFRDKPDFNFVIREQGSYASKSWVTKELPGSIFLDEEQYEFSDFASCRARISNWLDRLLEELIRHESDIPHVFAEMRKNLSSYIEQLTEPDTPFSAKESSEWNIRLDSLVEQFEKLKEEKKIQEGELANLKKEVQQLKELVTSVPKRTWLRSAGNKVVDILERLSNTKAAQALAEGVAKYLLVGGGQP